MKTTSERGIHAIQGYEGVKLSAYLDSVNVPTIYQGAASEFPKWNKAGGKVLQGLVNRRAAERAMFLEII